jgi:hypothetical protein
MHQKIHTEQNVKLSATNTATGVLSEKFNRLLDIVRTCMSIYIRLVTLHRIYHTNYSPVPTPVAARSKAWVCGRSPAEILGSNPAGSIDVCRECCVLSGRGLCDELITRPEESY